MPIKLSDYFVVHPTVPTKETCKACLSHLEAKRAELQNDKYIKESQRRNELLKKDGQIKRLYWRKGTKAERFRHLANCAHQTRRVREEAQLERSKKERSETPAAEDDATGPMSHFKTARDRPQSSLPRKPSTRPSRASSSTTTSYQEDSDDEAFEEMIATGEHAKYLENLKLEQERAERKAKREQLEAQQRKNNKNSDDEQDIDYSAYFTKSRSASPV